MNPTPKVTLLTHTNLPLETVYSVWEASKTENPLVTPEWVRDNVPREEVEKLFRAVIRQRIPIGEHCDFVFMLENVSVSFREQMVRHRIGTKPSPERVGADIVVGEIPGLQESSWWSQSMRIQDMGEFATKGAYRMPPSLEGKVILGGDGEPNFTAAHLFQDTMETIEDAYNTLIRAGVPMEDARELMPLGAQHRISWKLNISALQHIVGERGCWILQLGLWGPVIEGMIAELVAKVDPIFAELVTPPCIKGEEFKGCVYMEETRRRITGDDRLPPCPLHYTKHADVVEEILGEKPTPENTPRYVQMVSRGAEYSKFWGRNPYTGEKLVQITKARTA